jgi:hypothetical protein
MSVEKSPAAQRFPFFPDDGTMSSLPAHPHPGDRMNPVDSGETWHAKAVFYPVDNAVLVFIRGGLGRVFLFNAGS